MTLSPTDMQSVLSTLPLRRRHARRVAAAELRSALFRTMIDGETRTASEMAIQLGVTSKTIRRHLHYLRRRMGVPIQSSQDGFTIEIANTSPEFRRELLNRTSSAAGA